MPVVKNGIEDGKDDAEVNEGAGFADGPHARAVQDQQKAIHHCLGL